MDSDKLLNLATSLGCLLAESGAEISRVEEASAFFCASAAAFAASASACFFASAAAFAAAASAAFA